MKALVFTLFLLATTRVFALDILPYTPQAFSQAQQAGKGIALHFHADWCPTCRAQSKVFQSWAGNPDVPGTLFVADYDHERALRQQLGVRSQSTVVFFQGREEQGRLSFVTDPRKLRASLRSIH